MIFLLRFCGYVLIYFSLIGVGLIITYKTVPKPQDKVQDRSYNRGI